MTEEQIKNWAREKANALEENQTLGIYDRDEDMRYDEGYNDGQVSGYEEGLIEGYHEGQKEHEWHDLRKDPNDLPKDITSLYLVRVYSWDFGLSHLYKKYGMYIPTVCEWSGEHFKALNDMAYSNARNIKSCIAWCEIPTFDKE